MDLKDRLADERPTCVYGARGPISLERLKELPDGRLSYFMKRKGPNGTTHLVLTPQELLRELAALVPPPRSHMTRFGADSPAARGHGAFAPNSSVRRRVVPAPPPAPALPDPELPAQPSPFVPLDAVLPRHDRLPWADLLARTFGIDVLQCPRCDGRMRVLAYLSDPDVTAGILEHLGLLSSPPRLAPTRDPPQLDLA